MASTTDSVRDDRARRRSRPSSWECLTPSPRAWNGNSPTGFLMVHVALAVISLVLGTAIGRLGWKGLRALKAQDAAAVAMAQRAAEPDREKV